MKPTIRRAASLGLAGENLADLVMQFSREMTAFRFLNFQQTPGELLQARGCAREFSLLMLERGDVDL